MIWLLKLIDPIGGIVREISNAWAERERAKTDRERVAADERINTLQARRDVLVAEGGSRINAIMRFCIALGPATYLGKIYIYDKVLGLGTTDQLSPELWNVTWIVLGFYFLHETARFFKK